MVEKIGRDVRFQGNLLLGDLFVDCTHDQLLIESQDVVKKIFAIRYCFY